MSAARLVEPVPHVDPALHQGAEIAERAIDAIRSGTSDPDAVLRLLLRVLADGGHLVPTSKLRGLCARLQRVLGEGRS